MTYLGVAAGRIPSLRLDRAGIAFLGGAAMIALGPLSLEGSLLYELIDLRPIAAACRARGVSVVADNTWGSGYLLNPLQLGADVSLVAGTKYISKSF